MNAEASAAHTKMERSEVQQTITVAAVNVHLLTALSLVI